MAHDGSGRRTVCPTNGRELDAPKLAIDLDQEDEDEPRYNGDEPLFIGDFPIETSIHRGFSIAMFDYQRVFFFRETIRKCSRMIVGSRHGTDAFFCFFFTLQMAWEFAFFWACPTTPMSFAGALCT